ncbi:MAG: 2-oxoacid:acceptor oxidoreductase family protein [Myxococcota bacterium]|jgi:indolepyruvate ferredoxin oxidoreductase beta subunit|nr:2-oxoacid:acceptor oxidoreductase family protein [Myxococcota bacterium]
MKPMNIYISGVGGQGIGLLSEVLILACQAAGHTVHGCDTHGLAQRGGIVVSHLRLGDHVRTPRVSPGTADLVVSLERLEAYRAMVTMLKPGATVLYYDTVYEPIHVRMGQATYPNRSELEQAAAVRKARLVPVKLEGMADPRMQNVALLGRLSTLGVIEGLEMSHVENALREVVPQRAIEPNLEIFARAAVL